MEEMKKTFLPKETLVPKHVAIICDGNRRWARARNLPVFRGHQAGFDITPKIAKTARELGIHTLTFWAFSTENWDRSRQEIAFLMKKYEQFVGQHFKEAKKEKVRIIHLGRKDRLPSSLVKKIVKAEEETKDNSKYILNIALDYGGRDEIIRAFQKMTKEKFIAEKLTEQNLPRFLDTADQPYPYPDLLIRPSGEQRTSGMFAWQGAYTEVYWLPDHFPAFTTEMLREAVIDFSRRRRRFGGNDFIPKVTFDPQKMAKLELGWWQAHNNWKLNKTEDNKKKMVALLREWYQTLYGINQTAAEKLVAILFKAIECHGKKDWSAAAKVLVESYQLLKKMTNYAFTPSTAAELEVDWWRIHDELENDLDKKELEKAFRDYYGEIYRLSALQATKTAHCKTLATYAHDLAEENTGESQKYWWLTEKYLLEAYKALREVAS